VIAWSTEKNPAHGSLPRAASRFGTVSTVKASGFVFAYVLSGSVHSQVEGEPLGTYSAGQSWTEPPNSHHIVSANASKTKPARLIAYIIADDGAQATVYDKDLEAA